MKRSKLKRICLSLCTAFAIFVAPMTSLKANTLYEIVFKAGLHGTIDGSKSVAIPVEQGGVFPDVPTVTANEGYVFKGWNKELPSVGSSVDGKQIYVAQYDVIVSGVNYIVRYVNEDNVEIATPKASMGEEGTTILERAKSIPGYTYTTAQKEFSLSKGENSFVFTYTLTNPEEVIRYEREETTVVENNTNTPNNNAGQDNTGDNQTEVVPDNNTPKDNGDNTEVLPDNNTPKGKGTDTSSSNLWMIAGGVGAIAILGGLTFLVLKRKKEAEAK